MLLFKKNNQEETTEEIILTGWEEKTIEAYDFMNNILPLNYKKPFINNNKVEIIICRVDGKMAGGLFFTHRKYKKKRFLHIDYLAVNSEYRQKGIADRLMECCIEYAKINEYHIITVRTQEDNIPTIKCFEKHGFKINKKYKKKIENGVVSIPFYRDI